METPDWAYDMTTAFAPAVPYAVRYYTVSDVYADIQA